MQPIVIRDGQIVNANMSIIQIRWPNVLEPLVITPQPESIIFSEYFPSPTLIIDGIHLTSGYDRMREARIQAGLIPEDAKDAWIYGIGLGDLPRILLQRQAIRRLHVVLLNLGVATASFHYADHTDWLSDERVALHLGSDQAEVRIPFAAIPSCLSLADEASARIRDLVFLELATPFIREKHNSKNLTVLERFRENETFVRNDGDASEFFRRYPGITVAIAAAGPSLTDGFEWLTKQRKSIFLLAVNTAVKPLILAGILPDAVIAIDEEEKIARGLQGFDRNALVTTPLIYFPRVHGNVLKIWPGPRFVAYPNHEAYRDLAARYPRGKLFASGSVLHSAVDFAVRLGAARVVLFGADLAYPGGARYAANAAGEEKEVLAAGHWVLDGNGQKIKTSACLRGYLRDLERYITHHPEVEFVNASRKGAAILGTHFLGD